MANGHSPLFHPNGKDAHIHLDRSKLAIGGELFLVALQVGVGLLALNSQLKVVFFVVFMLGGLGVLVWWSGVPTVGAHTERRSVISTLISLLLGGTLLGLAIIAAPAVIAKIKSPQPVLGQSPIMAVYYLSVHVFRDDDGAGEQEGTDPPLVDIPVIVRDEFGGNYPHKTDRNGSVMIRLPHYGEISLGVCHQFQTHELSLTNDRWSNPSVVKVGIAPTEASNCHS